MPEKVEADVTSQVINDNQTWNTCPDCKKSWSDAIATPGLIHRTRVCAGCTMKRDFGKK